MTAHEVYDYVIKKLSSKMAGPRMCLFEVVNNEQLGEIVFVFSPH